MSSSFLCPPLDASTFCPECSTTSSVSRAGDDAGHVEHDAGDAQLQRRPVRVSSRGGCSRRGQVRRGRGVDRAERLVDAARLAPVTTRWTVPQLGRALGTPRWYTVRRARATGGSSRRPGRAGNRVQALREAVRELLRDPIALAGDGVGERQLRRVRHLTGEGCRCAPRAPGPGPERAAQDQRTEPWRPPSVSTTTIVTLQEAASPAHRDDASRRGRRPRRPTTSWPGRQREPRARPLRQRRDRAGDA